MIFFWSFLTSLSRPLDHSTDGNSEWSMTEVCRNLARVRLWRSFYRNLCAPCLHFLQKGMNLGADVLDPGDIERERSKSCKSGFRSVLQSSIAATMKVMEIESEQAVDAKTKGGEEVVELDLWGLETERERRGPMGRRWRLVRHRRGGDGDLLGKKTIEYATDSNLRMTNYKTIL